MMINTFNTIIRGRIYSLSLLFVLSVVMLSVFYMFPKAIHIDEIENLSGEWKISLKDAPEFAKPGYDDNSWDIIELPGSMIDYSLNKMNRLDGICWVRKTFKLESYKEREKLGLILGRIADADNTYFNGFLIGGKGKFKPDNFSMWNFPRNYVLPENIINYESDNVIAIRISYYNFFEILGKMIITDYNSMRKFNIASTFVNVVLGYISITAGMILFFVFSAFYLLKPDSKDYLYYFIPILCVFPIVLELCTDWRIYPDTHTRYQILALAVVGENVAHSILLHRMYKLSRQWIEFGLIVYFSLVLIMIFLIDKSTIRIFGSMIILMTILISTYCLTCHIYALFKKRPYARLFSFFGMSFLIFSIHDSLIFLTKFSSFQLDYIKFHPGMTFNLGSFLFFGGLTVILVNNFIYMMNKMTGLNENLENYIVENNHLSEKLRCFEKRPTITITNKTEEKLKSVLKHIEDNFRTDLSRSELAELCGIHPDSFGKQFKIYTGKKLGDYIYELRIEEAAKMLRDEDINIIDVAFGVGFESLRTFNRVFPKFMNTTPDKYRKSYRNNSS